MNNIASQTQKFVRTWTWMLTWCVHWLHVTLLTLCASCWDKVVPAYLMSLFASLPLEYMLQNMWTFLLLWVHIVNDWPWLFSYHNHKRLSMKIGSNVMVQISQAFSTGSYQKASWVSFFLAVFDYIQLNVDLPIFFKSPLSSMLPKSVIKLSAVWNSLQGHWWVIGLLHEMLTFCTSFQKHINVGLESKVLQQPQLQLVSASLGIFLHT